MLGLWKEVKARNRSLFRSSGVRSAQSFSLSAYRINIRPVDPEMQVEEFVQGSFSKREKLHTRLLLKDNRRSLEDDRTDAAMQTFCKRRETAYQAFVPKAHYASILRFCRRFDIAEELT
jgi:hypothetical protein